MKLISAFLSFTFTIMFVLFAYELARFLKCQLQTMFKALFKKKFRKKKANKDIQEVQEQLEDMGVDYENYSKVFGDVQVQEGDSEC